MRCDQLIGSSGIIWAYTFVISYQIDWGLTISYHNEDGCATHLSSSRGLPWACSHSGYQETSGRVQGLLRSRLRIHICHFWGILLIKVSPKALMDSRGLISYFMGDTTELQRYYRYREEWRMPIIFIVYLTFSSFVHFSTAWYMYMITRA